MTPQGSGRPYQPGTLQNQPQTADGQPASQMLSIRFVRASAGSISGMLDPYWDPDRNCQVSTTFVGDLKGDIIEGTFRSHFTELGSEATGHWRVTRRASDR